MRRPFFICFLAMLFAAGSAKASSLISDTIATITDRASLVVRVVCDDAVPGYRGAVIPGATKVAGMEPRTESIVRYSFTLREVIVNRTARTWQAGDALELAQFVGFTMSGGATARISIRLPSYQEGEEYILFLKERGGSFFTVGVDQGVFKVRDAIVSNRYMKFSMFRGMSPDAPGVAKALAAGKVSSAAPPASMPMKDFSLMISTLARDAREGS